MRQIIQELRTGALCVADVPAPLMREQGILVRNRASLVSAGTERMMLKLARKGLVGKARERPDLVRKVLDKVRRDGVLATLKTVRDKLDTEIPMGYSSCGEVLAVGARATGFEVGQRVACAGVGYANHAEINYIPRLLAAPLPAAVDDEAGAYATVGSIALQGIRNAEVRLGEVVAVLGLGLIGQLTVQLLRAAGCRTIGIDPAAARVELAVAGGADLALVNQPERTEQEVLRFTRGRGVDAVLITAATSSNEPVEQAARIARDRARVVMVGVTGMNLPRTPYFKKELSFVVSRSYGPGRYDPQYEEHGQDYPAGYVRWTENRNLEAFLDAVASGVVRPGLCTTHRFSIHEAQAAFEMILGNREPYLGVLLTYPEPKSAGSDATENRIVFGERVSGKPKDKVGVSILGAGGFARAVHLPNLAGNAEVALRGIVDAAGISARSAGKKFGFAFCASAESEVLDDGETDAVVIVTPHSQHADGVCRALAAGKIVFVEKPLAISMEQLQRVCQSLERSSGGLMVGFNRRFSPLAVELKEFVCGRGPLAVQYRCNAGPLPAEHWVSDPLEGGRIIGEACHFLDLFAYLTDSDPIKVHAMASPGHGRDDASITATYADGSVCQLIYTSIGSPAYSKERVEVFVDGCVGVIEDFRRLELHATGKRSKRRKLYQANKGHREEMEAFIAAAKSGGNMPIAAGSLVCTTLATFAALESIQGGTSIEIADLQRALLTVKAVS